MNEPDEAASGPPDMATEPPAFERAGVIDPVRMPVETCGICAAYFRLTAIFKYCDTLPQHWEDLGASRKRSTQQRRQMSFCDNLSQ